MTKGFIFDLDGVIVDTAKYHFIAWKRLADELGTSFTEEDNERLKGVSRMRSLDILLEIGGLELSEDQKAELATKKNNWYVEFIEKMPAEEILPGARDFLLASRAAGIKVVLGSASKNAMTILNRLQIIDLFDAVIDGTKVSRAKPDPEVFLKGAEAVGLKPEECLVFEDAEAGIEAARNAGMKCIGIGSPANLGDADMVINDLTEVSVEEASSL